MYEAAKGSRPQAWKFALLGLVVLAVATGAAASVRALDWRADRQRPMYHDVLLMAGLQYDLVKGGQEGVELSIDSASEPVRVGAVSFHPLPTGHGCSRERGLVSAAESMISECLEGRTGEATG